MTDTAALPFDEDRPYLAIPPSRRMLAGIVLALSNFMVVLDLTIANVSVPHISGAIGASLDQGAWIITSYAVAEAICVPLTAWLAQRFGTVRVFLISMLGFGIFSLFCGMSQTLPMLVLCRIGQGLCGGPIMPMSQTLMLRVFPPDKRAMAMGLWAITVMLGPAMGPILGGIISDDLSWHWIFLINVPIALIVAFAGSVLLTPVETATAKVRIDKVGLGLLILWIGCLQLMLDLGRERDWFADPGILALGIIALIGFCVFVIWELTEEHPVVDLRVFRHRGFPASLVTQGLGFGAVFSSVVVVPQWLQSTMGYSARQAGIVAAMQAFSAVIAGQIAARLMSRVDQRALVSFGSLGIGLATLARMRWTTGAEMFDVSWPIFVQGIGMIFLMIPLVNMSLALVNPEETASAAGMQNFVRSMAVAISTSVALTIWDNATVASRDMLAGRLQPDAGSAALSRLGFTAEGVRYYMSGLVDREALTIGLEHTFLVSALMAFVGAILIWTVPRPPKPDGSVMEGMH